MTSGGAEPSDAAEEEVAVVVGQTLPVPPGWKRLVTPKKPGFSTTNEVVYFAPTGEQIRNKRQLDQYLKSHPGGPSSKEFNWRTVEIPRRSPRLSNIPKATETPEREPPRKRQNTSSSRKRTKGKKDDIDAAGEETKASEEVEMIDAGDAGDKSKGDISTEELTTGDAEKDSGPKTEEKIDEMNIEKLENQEAIANETTSNLKDEEVVNNSLTTPALEERKEETEKKAVETEALSKLENMEEAEKQPAEPEAPSKMENNAADHKLTSDAKEEQVGSDSVLKPGLDENKELPDTMPEVLLTASSENMVENVEGVVPDGDGEVEKESVEANVGKDGPAEEASTEKLIRPEESKANNDNLEANQDGTKPIDNHSLSCEETSHEPKAPQVSFCDF